MAYSDTLNYVVGDTLPELTFSLKDANTAASGQTLDAEDSSTWAPIDITGATVKLRVRAAGETTINSVITTTITSGIGGTCATDFPTTAFPSAGVYEGELEITFATGGKQTVDDLIKFKVRDDFD